MRRMLIGPALYDTRRNRPVSSADYDELVEDDRLGVTPEGGLKFLYLRDAIPRRTTDSMLRQLNALPFNPARNSRRAAVRAETGGELAFGWIDNKTEGPKLFAPTLQLPLAYQLALVPLLNAMANLIADHLPAQWQAQVVTARHNKRMIIGNEWLNPDGLSFMRPHLLGARKCSLLPPLFSTIQINRNIRCRLHRDAGNLSGLACLTAFGSWEGAELCFPRFGVAFPLQPGDVLMADTGAELHGNVPPLMGTRISVVAFLRPMQRSSLRQVLT